jgi:hypothetical protein
MIMTIKARSFMRISKKDKKKNNYNQDLIKNEDSKDKRERLATKTK